MWLGPREKNDGAEHVINYVNPQKELNAGLWSLFAGATVFLCLRLWCKITRRHGLWYDDYVLILTWAVLLATDVLISYQYATGYVPKNGTKWDDRMHILINVSSCTNVIGQAWSKTAFGVTLLKLTNRWGQYIIWFCIVTMNMWMVVKNIFQWAKLCDEKSYNVWYRLDFCIDKQFRDDFKEAGNIYNVIMDFVFALFPWIITWKLDMKRKEKLGLCITMSLGVVIAIVAAVRIVWKDEGNKRDPYYYWRNGISNVWYNSEVAGTILVQCIPVLRTLLSEIHTSLTSNRLSSNGPTPNSWSWSIRKSNPTTTETRTIDSKGWDGAGSTNDYNGFEGTNGLNSFSFGFNETKISAGPGIELKSIPEYDTIDREKQEFNSNKEFKTIRIRAEDC